MAKLTPTKAMDCDTVYTLSIHEVTQSFGIQRTVIHELVSEGIVQVAPNEDEQNWQFNHDAITIIRTAVNLQRDLGINTAGVGLALELMREIDRLHGLLRLR